VLDRLPITVLKGALDLREQKGPHQALLNNDMKVFRICLELKNLLFGESVEALIIRSYAFFSQINRNHNFDQSRKIQMLNIEIVFLVNF